MSRLIGVVSLSLLLLMLLPASAWACGDDGESPCGGDCQWVMKGYCPFCIPWCNRDRTFCKAGYAEQIEVSLIITGEIVQYPVCRRTSTLPPPAPVTVDQALANGCRTPADITDIVNTALSHSNLGTNTRTKLTMFRGTDQWVTRSDVTDPNTWGYRAATIIQEEAKLMEGRLTTKAERRVGQYPPGSPDIDEFWSLNGPRLDPAARDSTSLALQMLATSSSDNPPSQFASVALDYSVAAAFGNIVYRFQLDPQSPVLGLRDCQNRGEVQIQPAGGTPIRNLQRFDIRKRYWERLQSGQWVRMNDKDEL